MLVIALVLSILAAAFAAFDFMKSAYTAFVALAIALFASAFAVYIVDVLQEQGKF